MEKQRRLLREVVGVEGGDEEGGERELEIKKGLFMQNVGVSGWGCRASWWAQRGGMGWVVVGRTEMGSRWWPRGWRTEMAGWG